MRIFVVLITVPRGLVARKLARKLVAARAAACVNIIPGIESHYQWKGKIEKSREALLVVKTVKRAFPGLCRLVEKNHPYSVPEIIGFSVDSGNAPYLGWVQSITRGDC